MIPGVPEPRLHKKSQSTGFSYSSTGSSSSFTRHGLDPESHSPIVVFHWIGNRPLEKSSEAALGRELEGRDNLRVTKMQIPKMTLCLEVERHNLYKGDERRRYRSYPNYNSSLASIKLPAYVFWPRMVGAGYENLYIVSPELSPSSSFDDSCNESTTSSDDVFVGAKRV